MNKTLYLYIGMPKTGSSTIHYFLCKNNNVLMKNGLIFPKMDAPCYCCTDVAYEYNNLHELYRQFLYKEIDLEGFEKVFRDEFCKQFDESGCHSMLLQSDEIFIGNRDLSFCDIFTKYGFDVKVIVYVRKPADYLTSWWCEIIKPYMPCPWAYTIRDAFENIYVQYDLILSFIEKYGKDNVIIKPFDRKLFKNGDLLEDFLDVFGFELTNEYEMVKNQNISFDRNTTEIMLLFHKLKLPFDVTEIYKNQVDFSKITNTKIVETLSDEFIQEITDKYAPVLDEIAKIYGKEHLFDNYYPDCYGKERPSFDKISISMEDLSVLHKAIEESVKIRNNLADENQKMHAEVDRLSQENQEMRRSIGYKIDRETRRIIKQAKNFLKLR